MSEEICGGTLESSEMANSTGEAGMKTSPLFIPSLLILAALLYYMTSANANEYYMQVGFGTHDTEYDDWKAENFLGNFVLGHRWDNEFYIELNHISSVQEDDEGLNVLFFGLRRKWEY